MIKKFKLINLMPLILAVVAAIAIIIACGKGQIEDIDKDSDMSNDIQDAIDELTKKIDSISKIPISSSVKESSSSTEKSSTSGTSTSSSSGTTSSTSGSSSSSNQAQSSSGESLYNLTCNVVVDTAIVNTIILEENRPKVECTKKANNEVVKMDSVILYWSNAPRWPSPQLGEYNAIEVTVEREGTAKECDGSKATCSGTFKVCPQNGCPSSSSATAISSSAVAPSSSSVVVPPASSSSRASSSSVVVPVSSSSRASSSSAAPITPSSSSVAPPPSSSSSAPPTYTVACTWAAGSTTMYTGQAKPTDPIITCTGTPAATGTATWAGLPPATLNIKATYIPVPSGIICGGVVPTNTPTCGTLTVLTAPTITCVGTAQTVTLPATPTTPTITLTDPDNICSANNSTTPNSSWTAQTWTVSKNGTDANNATWTSIFNVAGTYNNYRVTGKCGSYSPNLTATCTGGSATVNPAASCTTPLTIPQSGWNGGTNPQGVGGTAGCYTIACANGSAPFACYIPSGSSVVIDGTTITTNVTQSACSTVNGKTITITGSNVVCAGQW